MSYGFNTNVQVGDRIFHIQTEDRGPERPLIDTVVYLDGRVLHRRSSSYEDLAASPDFTEDVRRRRVQENHRAVIEALRTGTLEIESALAVSDGRPGSSSTGGIEVRLISLLPLVLAGNASLEVEVRERIAAQPLPGTRVEVHLEGAHGLSRLEGVTDSQGRLQLYFPLPALGREGVILVIRAESAAGADVLRFAVRPKGKATAPPLPS